VPDRRPWRMQIEKNAAPEGPREPPIPKQALAPTPGGENGVDDHMIVIDESACYRTWPNRPCRRDASCQAGQV
jgi:hypothetical protein